MAKETAGIEPAGKAKRAAAARPEALASWTQGEAGREAETPLRREGEQELKALPHQGRHKPKALPPEGERKLDAMPQKGKRKCGTMPQDNSNEATQTRVDVSPVQYHTGRRQSQ